MKKTWTTGLSAVLLAAGLCMGTPDEAMAASQLPNGIYVGEQDLGGMTREEAQQSVEAYIQGLASQKITLDVDGSLVDTTAENLGFHWTNTDAVEKIAEVYEGGNLIRRYMNQKDLEKEPVYLDLETAMDPQMVAAFVETECAPLTTQAKDATITRENGKFVVTPSVVGKAVDTEATRQQLDAALEQGLEEPIQVTAVIVETQPAKTTEMLSTIQDVLGTFSTDFSSSGAARSTNLKVGSAKINGRVLMPGEVLSGYECMQPFTKANGYQNAAAYENGQVVDSIGGGVCQIATTIYNTALLAEMDIVQRQNHSMTVSYVKPSNDAAIAGTYKDIKFRNPYDTPVYVEGYTSGKTLTFTIYGKETRPANRTIKYVSETLKTIDPGEPIMNVDPSLAPGQKVRVQSAHTGLKSRLWKYVYVDGVETEKTILHTDTYNASKAIYRVGPEAPAAAPGDAAPEGTTPGTPDGNGTATTPDTAPGTTPDTSQGTTPGTTPGDSASGAPGADAGAAQGTPDTGASGQGAPGQADGGSGNGAVGPGVGLSDAGQQSGGPGV